MIEDLYILLLAYIVRTSLKNFAPLQSGKLPCPLSRCPRSSSKILLTILPSLINSSLLSWQILWSLQHVIMISETLLNRLSKRFRRQHQRLFKYPISSFHWNSSFTQFLVESFLAFCKIYSLTCHVAEGYALLLSIRGLI